MLKRHTHLAQDELLDEGLVRVGARLLICREKGHLLEGDHRTREQAEDTDMPLYEAQDLRTEEKLDEGDSYHYIDVVLELSGCHVIAEVG